ncbi:MAG TPA: FAD-dependent oxidoreductase, partial [Deltaproteobacteria bacterium]|nr:FAD-dependent oxidoreductase [Deltaproteobacteria bacterium]
MADVVVIGAGPAGIFASMELVKTSPGIDLVMVEQGSDIDTRGRTGRDMLVGWGGAGAYSDGKLTVSTDVGGQLSAIMPEDDLLDLLTYVDGIYERRSPGSALFAMDPEEVASMAAKARLAGLVFVPARVRHLGTEHLRTILEVFRRELEGKARMLFGVRAAEILADKGRVTGVRLEDSSVIPARYVIAAPGRVGSAWMRQQAHRLGLESRPNPVDVGVRVELPAVVLEPLTSRAYETKFVHFSRTFDDKVRTFCMNPYGEVVIETVGDLVTVNGHSWATKRTENTNFALLVSANFTEPFDDPIGYGESVARLANMLGKGVIVQRLGDLLDGRRSTAERIRRGLVRPTMESATPGDLSLVLPYRHL